MPKLRLGTIAIVSLVSAIAYMSWTCCEKTGVASSCDELNLSSKEKLCVAKLGLSRSIYYWTRPCSRPCIAFLVSAEASHVSEWQRQQSTAPADWVQPSSLEYWISRLAPQLPNEILDSLRRVDRFESYQVILDHRVLDLYYSDAIEFLLVVSHDVKE
jgi:hypothetical protein